MSEKPKEIWCGTGLYYTYKEDWSEGEWSDNEYEGGVKYVRADLIEELEAKLAKVTEELEEYKWMYEDLCK